MQTVLATHKPSCTQGDHNHHNHYYHHSHTEGNLIREETTAGPTGEGVVLVESDLAERADRQHLPQLLPGHLPSSFTPVFYHTLHYHLTYYTLLLCTSDLPPNKVIAPSAVSIKYTNILLIYRYIAKLYLLQDCSLPYCSHSNHLPQPLVYHSHFTYRGHHFSPTAAVPPTAVIPTYHSHPP